MPPKNLSAQSNPDVARLRRERERSAQADAVRLDDLDAHKAYLRNELLPYLRGLATFVAYTPPPDLP